MLGKTDTPFAGVASLQEDVRLDLLVAITDTNGFFRMKPQRGVSRAWERQYPNDIF